MNRQEIIKLLQKPFCPALLPDKVWEVAGEIKERFGVCIGRAEWSPFNKNVYLKCTSTYRLDPDYTETMEYVDYEIVTDENGFLCYINSKNVTLYLRTIPESKLGGYIFEDEKGNFLSMRTDTPVGWLHKVTGLVVVDIIDPIDKRILAKTVRVYK